MTAILWAIGSLLTALAIAIGIMLAIGSRMPAEHVAIRRARIPAPIDAVYARLADVERGPEWRSDVKAIEIVRREPRLRWKERGRHGEIEYERDELVEPASIITRIVSEDLPFGGRWIYALAAEGEATSVTITEEGEVRPALFRFLSRYVFGHTATIDGVLRALARSFGSDAQPE